MHSRAFARVRAQCSTAEQQQPRVAAGGHRQVQAGRFVGAYAEASSSCFGLATQRGVEEQALGITLCVGLDDNISILAWAKPSRLGRSRVFHSSLVVTPAWAKPTSAWAKPTAGLGEAMIISTSRLLQTVVVFAILCRCACLAACCRASSARMRLEREWPARARHVPRLCGSVMAGAALVGPWQPTRHRRDLGTCGPWVLLGLTVVVRFDSCDAAQTDERADGGRGEVRVVPLCPELWPVQRSL